MPVSIESSKYFRKATGEITLNNIGQLKAIINAIVSTSPSSDSASFSCSQTETGTGTETETATTGNADSVLDSFTKNAATTNEPYSRLGTYISSLILLFALSFIISHLFMPLKC
jgi:hypothetical protein